MKGGRFLINISQNDFALVFCLIYLILKVFRSINIIEDKYTNNFRYRFRKVILGNTVKLVEESNECEYLVDEKISFNENNDIRTLKHRYLFNEFIYTSFIIYLIFLFSKIYFPMNISLWEVGEYRFPSIWLRPIWSLMQVYKSGGTNGLIYQIGGNLILLTPLAFYMLYFRSDRFVTLKDILLLCLKVSICIETSQLILSFVIPEVHRYFEINDIICNTLGGILGFGIYKLFIFLLNKYGVLKSKNKMIS